MFQNISLFDWIQITVIAGTFLLSVWKTLFPNKKNSELLKKNTDITENIEQILQRLSEDSLRIKEIVEKKGKK